MPAALPLAHRLGTGSGERKLDVRLLAATVDAHDDDVACLAAEHRPLDVELRADGNVGNPQDYVAVPNAGRFRRALPVDRLDDEAGLDAGPADNPVPGLVDPLR